MTNIHICWGRVEEPCEKPGGNKDAIGGRLPLHTGHTVALVQVVDMGGEGWEICSCCRVRNSGQCCNCGVGQVEGGEQHRRVSWFGDVAGLCECPSG